MKELNVLGKSVLLPTNDEELFTYNDEVMIPKFKAYCEWALKSLLKPLLYLIILSYVWINIIYKSAGFETTLLSMLIVLWFAVTQQLTGIARRLEK